MVAWLSPRDSPQGQACGLQLGRHDRRVFGFSGLACNSGPHIETTRESTGAQWKNKWKMRWGRYNITERASVEGRLGVGTGVAAASNTCSDICDGGLGPRRWSCQPFKVEKVGF